MVVCELAFVLLKDPITEGHMKQPKIETITNKIRHWQKLLQFATLLGVLVLGILANAPPALAWKPTTHVYLGQQALKDALDDSKVSIYRVDYKTFLKS
jgi:hypothetical protein